MAEAVLEVVLDNLSSLVQKEVGLFLGFDQDLKSLASLLTTIKATLEDAEEKQFSNRAIKDWLQKLKDAAYILDDILDECNTQALEYEGSKVHNSFLSSLHPKHAAFRYKLAKKMKRIRDRLDEIAAEKSKFHLTEIVRDTRTRVIDWRETTSIITQPQVYGRDEDKDKIVDFLIHEASELEDLSVYPLIGIGGLGKTTLAQLIFNHESIINHFDLRIWVCVSEDFSPKRMTKAIIGSVSGNTHGCEDLELEPLQRKLRDLLQRKRYLLVFDDLWDEQQENWQRLRSVLACGGKGTSVLVTTRLLKVAEIMGTRPPHELSMLSDKDCWELFKQRAFGPNEVERAELVAIGKEILKKCGGVPLAALALGSFLRFKREEEQWISVKESNLWSLQGENSVVSALKLSYLHLSVELRQCFAFCALFPKDEIISKRFLIELWVANGFISSNKVSDAEDVGNDVWDELHWRSFFQDIQKDKFGKITSFKMHDLVHDLAQSVTEEIYCGTYNIGVADISGRTRHLSIDWGTSFEEVNSIKLELDHVKLLKTYITTDYDYFHTTYLPPQVLECNSLRVLSISRLHNLSTSIGCLKYLRYLNISKGYFETLPESLCSLYNLQVLKLDYCRILEKLPDKFLHLKALRHLSLMECNSLSSLPPQIGKLTSLRTLSIYIVGKKRGSLLEELGQLNLKGELHIKHLERVKSATDAKEANMSRKHLNKLWLSWERNEESQLQENIEQILEVLQPHTQKLYSLGVGGYKGTCFPQWMSGSSLQDLIILELNDCINCLNLPELWKLPSLKYLKISNLSHVTCLCEVSYSGGIGGFMALEVLILEKLPSLMRLSREDGENMFPRLSRLRVTECPNLLSLPSLRSLIDLCIEGEYNQDLPSSIHKFSNLESLHFSDNKELTCFPDGILRNLTSLKILGFHKYSKLKLLPTEIINLGALQELYISRCHGMESLTDQVLQGLRSLRELEIYGCDQFNLSASFQYLTCLHTLTIGSCSKVEGFHETLQHMTTLQSLRLSDLPNLLSLPDYFGNLSSLHGLTIMSCPKLTCLPTTFQQLNRLKGLTIFGCPELERRCRKEIGEDWPKIAHVPHINIENFEGAKIFGYCGRFDEDDAGFSQRRYLSNTEEHEFCYRL